MVAEYINKEKLLQKLQRMIDYCKKDNKVNGLTALLQMGDAIMDCPSVEFVKCRYCQYRVESDKTNRSFCAYHGKDMEIFLDDYCSCGVEKSHVQKKEVGERMQPLYSWFYRDTGFLKMPMREKIGRLIAASGYTQKQIALLSGCTEATISWLVNGKHTPRKCTLKKLATALGVDADELIKMTEN